MDHIMQSIGSQVCTLVQLVLSSTLCNHPGDCVPAHVTGSLMSLLAIGCCDQKDYLRKYLYCALVVNTSIK